LLSQIVLHESNIVIHCFCSIFDTKQVIDGSPNQNFNALGEFTYDQTKYLLARGEQLLQYYLLVKL
jgi:hypothetical protein